MKEGFLDLNEIKIYYVECNAEMPNTIFFIHGNSLDSNCWKKQLVNPLLQGYRMVAIDLPAHGKSGTSQNPEKDYSLPGLANLISQAILKLVSGSYILVGLSLGTNIIVEALPTLKQAIGIVLASPCIVGSRCPVTVILRPDTHVHVVFTESATENEIKSYAQEVMYCRDIKEEESFINSYHNTKREFRSYLGTSIQNQQYNDEIAIVQGYTQPLLIIFGKNEKLIDPNYLDEAGLNLWKNTIYKIENAGHLVTIDHARKFNNLLAAYAEEIFS